MFWYKQYRDTKTGVIIDGNDVRLFMDWDVTKPEQPRYAQMVKPNGIITYLDSELVPIGEPLP